MKPPEGLDEDDLACSDYSMELLSLPFRTDRYIMKILYKTGWGLPLLYH